MSRRHWPALNGLRGLAILLVLVDHGGYTGRRTAAGVIGVTVFFVLSGFLITTVLLERGERGDRLGGFFRARAVRLLPALVLLLAVATPVAVVCGEHFGRVWPAGLSGLLYVQNFYFARHTVTLFTPLWSLAVEEQFYLLWPFVLPLVVRSRARWWLLGAGITASIMLRVVLAAVAHRDLWAYSSLPTNSFGLLLGAGLALSGLRHVQPPRWLLPTASAALGALLIAPSWRVVDFKPIVAAVLAVPLIWGLLSGSRAFELTPMTFLGRISYSLYLWHWPLLWMLNFPTRGLAIIPTWATLLLSIAVATASTLLVEEPLRRRWRQVPAVESNAPRSSRISPEHSFVSACT